LTKALVLSKKDDHTADDDIDGILVVHRESVSEQSTEAFIIRLCQSQRQQAGSSGFVKAFSDSPDQLLTGFAKVDKVLKSLNIQKLYLYSRFHHAVRKELEHPACTPSVTEFHQPLSLLQKDIQNAIAAAVVKYLRQLRNSTERSLVLNNNDGSGNGTSAHQLRTLVLPVLPVLPTTAPPAAPTLATRQTPLLVAARPSIE
jgi:hypothetical protein